MAKMQIQANLLLSSVFEYFMWLSISWRTEPLSTPSVLCHAKKYDFAEKLLLSLADVNSEILFQNSPEVGVCVAGMVYAP